MFVEFIFLVETISLEVSLVVALVSFLSGVRCHRFQCGVNMRYLIRDASMKRHTV